MYSQALDRSTLLKSKYINKNLNKNEKMVLFGFVPYFSLHVPGKI